jgi:hypothetical protein
MASSTLVPATKRLDKRCPSEERSASPRKEEFSDREMKNALSTASLQNQN